MLVAEQLEFGGVGINVNDVTELAAPCGGWKESGFGRELGPEGLEAYLEPKHIRIRLGTGLAAVSRRRWSAGKPSTCMAFHDSRA
ncbi:MAG: aldehyde dehydrogenase family protein [Candidatus Dormibacteraeota bacterium]|nr:aldehyde dehydrogenase family protein [Candidatus Dormibacteraeota bacterium]